MVQYLWNSAVARPQHSRPGQPVEDGACGDTQTAEFQSELIVTEKPLLPCTNNMDPASARLINAGLAIVLAIGIWGFSAPLEPAIAERSTQETEVLQGKEREFGDAFVVSLGGKLYDDFWEASDTTPPKRRNPAFPSDISTNDKDSWRCVSCHGWDYDGADKAPDSEQQRRQFLGLRHLRGLDPYTVTGLFAKAHADHPIQEQTGVALDLLVLFVSAGQYETRDFQTYKSLTTDGFNRARDIFEGVCMSCHDPDGKSGFEARPGLRQSLGWLARNKPKRTMHKIVNGVPGRAMLSLRFLDEAVVLDVIRYLKTLDQDAE
jgi:thiosulfate dehydrogenase